MTIAYNTSIVRNGLVLYIDPFNLIKHGPSPYQNLSGLGIITNNNFQEVDNSWRSNVDISTGAGTSELNITGIEVTTGSFTMIIWLKRTSNPNIGTNNNWRSVFMNSGTSQNPFGILMEQNSFIQFSLTTSLRSYRNISGSFTQFLIPLNEWVQVIFSYDKDTGIASAYRNGELIRSGPMTQDANSSSPSESVSSLTTGMTYKISNNRNATDPSGTGCFPGDIGPAMIYNRALTAQEVQQNFNALKGRYNV
jgi:hypothetical protein